MIEKFKKIFKHEVITEEEQFSKNILIKLEELSEDCGFFFNNENLSNHYYSYQIRSWHKSINDFDRNYENSKKKLSSFEYSIPFGRLLGVYSALEIINEEQKKINIENDELKNNLLNIKNKLSEMADSVYKGKVSYYSFQLGKKYGQCEVLNKFIKKIKNNEFNIKNISDVSKITMKDTIKFYEI